MNQRDGAVRAETLPHHARRRGVLAHLSLPGRGVRERPTRAFAADVTHVRRTSPPLVVCVLLAEKWREAAKEVEPGEVR
jgi:hypothetical protein